MHARLRHSGQRSLTAFILVGMLGLVLGLTYAWFINPVEYVDVNPSQLNEEEQHTFLVLTGLAYASEGNLERARQRLVALGITEPAQAVSEAADDAVALGLPETSIRALANLTIVLGGQPEVAAAFAGPLVAPTMATSSPQVGSPTQEFVVPEPTPLPTPTATPLPPPSPTPSDTTITPTATPETLAFVLVDLATLCDADHVPGLIAVQVQDASGSGLHGIQVQVKWEGAIDTFFTGLKPEENAGYGDFVMSEGEVYQVQLVDGSESLSRASQEIAANRCISESDGDSQLTAYRLVFRQTG